MAPADSIKWPRVDLLAPGTPASGDRGIGSRQPRHRLHRGISEDFGSGGSLHKFEQRAHLEIQRALIATLGTGHSGNKKLLHYDVHRLLQLGAIPTALSYGTALTLDPRVYHSLGQYWFSCALIAVLYWRFAGDYSELVAALYLLSKDLQRLTPFVFGLYVARTIGRWWAFRMQGISALMDAVVHVISFLAEAGYSRLSGDDLKDFEKELVCVLRYGIASLSAVAELSRAGDGVRAMRDCELVSEDEAIVLRRFESHVRVLWSWIHILSFDILDRCKLEPPRRNVILNEIAQAESAANKVEAYHDSQIPFCYLHMIVFLIFMNNYCIAFYVGAKLGDDVLRGSSILTIVSDVLYVLLVPSLLQMLLQICVQLEDPLGEELSDFPIMLFQLRVYDASKSIMKVQGWFHKNVLKKDHLSPALSSTKPATSPPLKPPGQLSPVPSTAAPTASPLSTAPSPPSSAAASPELPSVAPAAPCETIRPTPFAVNAPGAGNDPRGAATPAPPADAVEALVAQLLREEVSRRWSAAHERLDVVSEALERRPERWRDMMRLLDSVSKELGEPRCYGLSPRGLRVEL